MPLSDLEAPSNNGDGALETLAAAAEEEEEEEEEESDPEMPPESFRIGIGEEFDWAELNAVLDRDDSTRGSANPKSQQQQHHHHHANPSKPRSDDSQRFSGIIVLPGAIPISGAYLGRSARRARRKKMAGNGGGRAGRGAVPETDPGSPKVSCAGKVMSQRDRHRNPGILRRSPEDEDEEERGGRRGSFVAVALRLFRGCGAGPSPSDNAPAMVAAAPPGLGGMKRFASGRKGECSCGGDADGGMYCHVALSRPLDREVVAGNASVGPFEEMGRGRD
ncbi:hypothetical protein ACMD2_03982 [Ananas comosus]|uniref:Uncharacterized protein n=1 Tax=Ananas comosus TaxID=4615 RepID=A0A199UGX9_ANACO|nr:hypothetical protein ACMD2_03982 [Ananas comosus]